MISKNAEQLEGGVIRLVPLMEEHKSELVKVLNDPLIWEYTWRRISTEEQVGQLIDAALVNKAKGTDIPLSSLSRLPAGLPALHGSCIWTGRTAMQRSAAPGFRRITGEPQ